MVEIWGETAAGQEGAGAREAIFFPGAGRDPLGEDEIAARGSLMAIAATLDQADRRAARAAIATLVPAYYNGDGDAAASLRWAASGTNGALEGRATPNVALIAAVLIGQQLYLANTGGGRAYLAHGATVEPLTREPDRDRVVSPEFSLPITLHPGDRLLLCSEALVGPLESGQWGVLLGDRPREAAAQLIALARARGALGDLSLIVARAGGGMLFSPSQWVVLLVLGAMAAGLLGWFLWELWRYLQ